MKTIQQVFTETIASQLEIFGASTLQPLNTVKLNNINGWVYDRRYGVFNCISSAHELMMSTLLAADLGIEDITEIPPKFLGNGKTDYQSLAGYWLINTQGTAFKSSMCKAVMVGKEGNLNDFEKSCFGDIIYIEQYGIRESRNRYNDR